MLRSRFTWLLPLVAALVLSLLSLWVAGQLRIEGQLVDLLPAGTPAAEEYRSYLERFGGLETVYVMVTAADSAVSGSEPGGRGGDEVAEEGGAPAGLLVEVAEQLAAELESHAVVAEATAGISPEDLTFLTHEVLPRAVLAAPEEAVAERLATPAIADRVAELRRRLRSPAGRFAALFAAADPLGLAETLAGGTGSAAGGPIDPETGGFLSRDGAAALVLVTPAGSDIDSETGKALEAALANALAAVQESIPGRWRLSAVGGPLYAAQDERLFRRDLTRTVGFSIVAIALLLLLFFRGLRAPLAILLAVAAGVLWTGAAAAVLYGAVSALGVAFAAILLGLGVDYGIHGATRFRQYRLGGKAAGGSLFAACRDAGPAILTSAVTTALAFGVLSFGHFRPVRELGVLVLVGILAILVATLAVGAPILVLTAGEREDSKSTEGWIWRVLGRAVEIAVAWGRRRRRVVLVVALLLTAAALVGVRNLSFNGDLRSLRPADHPAMSAESALATGFDLGLDRSTVVVFGQDRAEALGRAAEVTRRLRAIGADVTSPADWLAEVPGRRQRLPAAAAAGSLRQALTAEGFALSAFERPLAVLDALAAGAGPPPIDWSAAPSALGRLLAEDAEGAWVAVSFGVPVGRWPAGPPPEILRGIEPRPAVASVPRLAAEIKDQVAGDLRRLGGIALALVALVVLVSFPGRPGRAVLALLPVTLGTLWTLGACGLLGLPLDPFTLLVAPLLLGIGVDDGLHALHGAGALHRSVLGAGRAMALTTLTTVIGFGSLALSGIPALRGGGLVVALGTALCLLVTLILLPALERLRREDPEGSSSFEPFAVDQPAPDEVPPHAPRTGRMARWLGPFSFSGVFWFRLHAFAARTLPERVKGWVIAVMAVLFWTCLRGVRRAIVRNLEPVLGPVGVFGGARRSFRTVHNLAWCMTERWERLETDVPFEVQQEGVETWRELLSRDRGFILVTAHIGSWEVGSTVPSSEDGVVVHVVREEEMDAKTQAALRRAIERRTGSAYRTHFASTIDPRLGIRLLEALRQGEVVALQGDRPRAAGRSIEMRLFGRPYRMPVGPAALARSAEVPLMPVFVFREGRRRYRVAPSEPIYIQRTQDRSADLRPALETLAAAIEEAVRHRPYQWFCFRDLWPKGG